MTIALKKPRKQGLVMVCSLFTIWLFCRDYFPIQNFPKILPKISSVVTSPVISPK